MNTFRWSKLAAVTGCSALVLACRVNPTSPDMENSSEGRACPPDALIEDAEDGNNQIVIQDGRSGYVYTFADSAGSTVDPPGGAAFRMSDGGANGTEKALRIQGSIGSADVVYAGLGLNFTDPRGPYDMSKYQGISFYAKKGPGSTGKVRLRFPDQNTDPEGGICGACSNDFGMQLSLTEQWQKFIVPFSALKQESGWGSPRPMSLESEAVFALQMAINDKGKGYDIWVDEIAFTGCE